MKKIIKNLEHTMIAITLLLSLTSWTQQPDPKFSKNQVLKDLAYLYRSLIDAHYDLYAYTPKEAFEDNYRWIKTTITQDSLNSLEATTIFQKLISLANNGHTEIDFPAAAYRTYAYGGGTLFPLEIAFEDNKSLVRKNYSTNHDIHIGDEILTVNGVAMIDVLAKIYPQISGERTYLKNAKIEMYSFPRLYWQVFGQIETFHVEIKEEGKRKNYSLDAVNLIEGYEMKRKDILNSKMTLNFIKNTAYLNPGDFGGDEEIYQKFIDSAFIQINDEDSKNLIIDLRNNKGGDNSFSDYLVSYIADKPFRWNSRLTLKTSKFLKEHTRKNNDTTEIYFKNILDHKNGEKYEYQFESYQPQTKDKRFKGDIFILVNRQSHSQSAVTAAQIQDYKFGTIVGEETGDYPTLYASQFQYALPNTSIVVKVAKGRIVRINGSEKQEGVKPDVIFKDHLLDDQDEILNGLLTRLN